jgi:uncharacterized membrane protein
MPAAIGCRQMEFFQDLFLAGGCAIGKFSYFLFSLLPLFLPSLAWGSQKVALY